MEIKLGDIFWLEKESDFEHPHVVIKIENENITICGITTNAKKANLPGNIILEKGEGGLEKESIVDVAKVYEVSRKDLSQHIGNLSGKRVLEILAGINFLEKSFFQK